MTHRDWDLSELRAMWARRRAAVARAKQGIDTAGMTRPRRDPVKREWLERHGDPGPFVEAQPLRDDKESEARNPAGPCDDPT